MERINFNAALYETVNGNNKYGIAYYVRGIQTFLNDERYIFTNYDEAASYITNHNDELNDFVAEQVRLEEEARRATEEANRRAEEARRAAEEAENSRRTAEEANRVAAAEKNKRLKVKSVKKSRFGAGFLAGLVLVGLLGIAAKLGYNAGGKGNTPVPTPTSSSIFGQMLETPTPTDQLTYDDITDTGEYSQEYVEFTKEKFEELCVALTKSFSDKGIALGTDDIIKFVMITNIDRIATDCPELIAELQGSQTKEQMIADAGKCIGAIASYNASMFAKNGNVENFVSILPAVFEEQKELVKQLESYLSKICAAHKAGKTDELNRLVSELLVNLNSENKDLYYIDNGVGFAIQAYIESILTVLTGNLVIVTDPITGLQYPHGDELSDENASLLHQFSTAARFVPNISAAFGECNTRTLSK